MHSEWSVNISYKLTGGRGSTQPIAVVLYSLEFYLTVYLIVFPGVDCIKLFEANVDVRLASLILETLKPP